MQTRLLKSFVTVAETLHFARAAQRLGLAQATLSQQVVALECEMGVQLLLRNNRSVRLTPAGESFVDEARVLMALSEAAVHRAQQIARGESGRLKVGVASSALFDLLPLTLARLSEQCPALDVSVCEHTSTVQEAMLLAGEIDVGMLHPPLLSSGLRSETVMSEPMVLALWTGHPLADLASVPLSALERCVLLVPERETCPHLVERIEHALCAAHTQVRHQPGPCAAHTVLSQVAARRGVAVMPGAVRHLPWPGVAVRPLTGHPLQLELAVAWRAGEPRAAVLKFRSAVSSCVEDRRVLAALQHPGG